MKHPLDFLALNARKPLFLALLALTVILFAVMQVLGAPLKTDAAPVGIVSFELAGTTEKAFHILVSWEPVTNGNGSSVPVVDLYAAFGLGFDYLFMPAYALTIALGVLLASSRYTGWLNLIGAIVGWGALIAALFDAVENFALWKVLLGEILPQWTMLAAVCATIKFALIVLGILYSLIGGLLPKRSQS